MFFLWQKGTCTLIDPKDSLADVDSLISRCRDERTKPFLTEAIACYKGGAFRAAIVTIWITVVFDLIAKFRELDLTGDKNANIILAQFERIHLEKDPKKSIQLAQDFERDILATAKDKFDLLSSLQHKDLLRLYEDRHRCAHPSMHSLEQPYQPTKELVRYHLQSAVTCLLQHPPVQGKAALDYIWADIHSEYFPTTVQEASKHFAHGLLARTQESLLRSVIIGLTRDLLTKQRPLRERQRQHAALGAALQLSYQRDDKMHQGNEILNSQFSLIVSSLSDAAWPSIISYLHYIPSAWDALGEPEKNKAFRFMQSCSPETVEQVMTEALNIAALEEMAGKRLPDLSIDSLARLLSQSKQPEYVEEAIGRWGMAESFEDAKVRTKKLIIPFLPMINATQIAQIVALFQEKPQLYRSFVAQDMMLDLFKHSCQYSDETKSAWVHLYENCCLFINGKLVQQDLQSLLSLIEDTYPDVIDLATAQAQEKYVQRLKNSAEDEDVGEL